MSCKWIVLPSLLCVIFAFSIKCLADTDLSKLHSDEVFKRALLYDAEINRLGFDPDVDDEEPSDQLLAEKYYLEFLTRTSHWKAKSRTYCRLGVLFSTNFDSTRGEKADFQKAGKYFDKCIEIAGDRVTWCVVRSRSMKITSQYPADKRFQMRMDLCHWLFELQAADITDRMHFQSNHYPEIEANNVQKEIKAFKENLGNVIEVHQQNMVGDALAMENPKVSLLRITQAFPRSNAALKAQKLLDQILNQK